MIAWRSVGRVTSAELLIDAFDRVRGVVHRVVADLSADQLAWRPDDGANSIAWLVWHLTRIQDDHVAGVAGADQVWTTAGWADRFDSTHCSDDGPGKPHPATFRVHEADKETPYCCDYVYVTPDLAPRLRAIRVDGATQASDHQPVIVELA